jgi:hypothetical protein
MNESVSVRAELAEEAGGAPLRRCSRVGCRGTAQRHEARCRPTCAEITVERSTQQELAADQSKTD